MKKRLIVGLVCLAEALTSSAADINHIRQVYDLILSPLAGQIPPTPDQIFNALDGLTDLSADETSSILPLARRCLNFPDLEVRRAGMLMLLSVSLRPDSHKLLEPYIDDLGAVVKGGNSPLRAGALNILGSTHPVSGSKAAGILKASLRAENSPVGELIIAASGLLQASSSSPDLVHDVLMATELRSNGALTSAVIRELGNLKIRGSESLAFIEKGLRSTDVYTRGAALQSVAWFEPETRSKFRQHIYEIANDANETPEVRSQARALLNK